MKWSEIVEDRMDELFNSSSIVRWRSNDSEEWVGRFDVDDMTFDVVITNDDGADSWVVSYQVIKIKDQRVNSNDSWQPTGAAGQNASKVLGSVIAAVEQFVDEMNPTEIMFVGDKDNGLANLYHKVTRALASRMAKRGFTNATKSGSSYFRLVKNQKNEGN